MGITIRKPLLESRLEDAVRLADSAEPLPEEWAKRVDHISQCPSETYIAAFGVALLAKATDPRVDVLTVKAGAGPTAYSMRGVAKVLAGRARHYCYHLGVTGPEPLNNQPWYSSSRMDRFDSVRGDVVLFHQAFVRYLRDLQLLDADEALLALAAFLRLRLKVGRAQAQTYVLIANAGAALSDVLQLAEAFIRQNPEGGKRGQAVVAAMLDCVHDEVQTGAINNPRAFDVRVDAKGAPVLAVEVKQKPVGDQEVLYLAAEAGAAGVDKALYAALAADQPWLDAVALRERAASESGVFLGVAIGVAALADLVLLGSSKPATVIASELPIKVLDRLEQLRASEEGRGYWSGLFGP